jgi:hypothetical protein
MGFMGCATIALVCTLFLICLDARHGGKLNASATERAERLAREEAEQEAVSVQQEHVVGSRVLHCRDAC